MRGALPHRPDEASFCETGVEGEWRRPARQLKADATPTDLRRHGLHIRMADTEDDDRTTRADDERDLARPIQGVRADPGTGEAGAWSGRLGAGGQEQGERDGEQENPQAIS